MAGVKPIGQWPKRKPGRPAKPRSEPAPRPDIDYLKTVRAWPPGFEPSIKPDKPQKAGSVAALAQSSWRKGHGGAKEWRLNLPGTMGAKTP